jgi:hypothetical protein
MAPRAIEGGRTWPLLWQFTVGIALAELCLDASVPLLAASAVVWSASYLDADFRAATLRHDYGARDRFATCRARIDGTAADGFQPPLAAALASASIAVRADAGSCDQSDAIWASSESGVPTVPESVPPGFEICWFSAGFWGCSVPVGSVRRHGTTVKPCTSKAIDLLMSPTGCLQFRWRSTGEPQRLASCSAGRTLAGIEDDGAGPRVVLSEASGCSPDNG